MTFSGMGDSDWRDEAELSETLAQQRWGPTGFCCPHCQQFVTAPLPADAPPGLLGPRATALVALRKASRLKRDEHEFYELRGLVETALGKSREATKSFERARELEAVEALRVQARVAFGGLASPQP